MKYICTFAVIIMIFLSQYRPKVSFMKLYIITYIEVSLYFIVKLNLYNMRLTIIFAGV